MGVLAITSELCDKSTSYVTGVCTMMGRCADKILGVMWLMFKVIQFSKIYKKLFVLVKTKNHFIDQF